MRLPRVSVCIPTYNRSHYLRQTIQSVFAQTFSDYELLVVDNASTDQTPQVVAEFRDGCLRYHRNERNLGMVGNWNRCVELARGEYVAILHDDDWWHERYLERVVPILDRRPTVGLVHTTGIVTDAAGSPRSLYGQRQEDSVISGRQEFRTLVAGRKIFTPTVTVRRQCYERLGPFDESIRYAADWDMWLRICLFYDVAYLAEPLAFYRTQGGSWSDSLSLSVEGRRFILTDAVQVVEKAMQAALAAGCRDLARVAGRALGARWFRCAVASHKDGDFERTIRELRHALSFSPALAFRRPHVITAFVSLFLLGKLLPPRLFRNLQHAERRMAKILRRIGVRLEL